MEEIRFSISNSEIQNTRRLFIKMLLFIPLLLVVAAVNMTSDPAGLYGKKMNAYQMDEYRIAQMLVSGQDVKVDHPLDHRLLEKYLIENITTAPDIIVLGSSHSLWIGSNIFPDQKVINNSVPDAELTDYLGIFEGYARKNMYPQRVILLADPQLISFPIFSDGWVSIKNDTYSMLDRLSIRSQRIKKPVIPSKWLNIFSFSYFQQSIKSPPTNPANEEMGHEQFLIFKDGRCLPARFAKSRTKTGKLNYGDYEHELLFQTKPDDELKNILEHFIGYLTLHHVHVTLVLLPLHPELYQELLDPQKKKGTLDLVGVEQYYHALAQKLNLEIIGSYDPSVCHLGTQDFYNGDHIRNDTIEGMFKEKGSACSMPGI